MALFSSRKRKPARTSTVGENIRFLVTLIVLAVLLRSLIAAPFSIPSESMLPRLLIGDYLFVAKWPYGYSRYSFPFGPPLFSGRILGSAPKRGDVVVFKAPPGNDVDYIKRVIGLPGDQVQMKNGQLYLNGDAIPKVRVADLMVPVSPNSPCRENPGELQKQETEKDGSVVCRYPRFRETLPGGKSYDVLDTGDAGQADNTPVYLVPEDRLFLMGDNRDHSADSRFPAVEGGGIGFVPQENLVGRAMIGFWSTDGSASWLLPWTWFTAARWSRIGEGF